MIGHADDRPTGELAPLKIGDTVRVYGPGEYAIVMPTLKARQTEGKVAVMYLDGVHTFLQRTSLDLIYRPGLK